MTPDLKFGLAGLALVLALVLALGAATLSAPAIAGSDIVFGSNPTSVPSSPRQYACQRAFRAVVARGYERVSVLECKGKHYSFRGYLDGAWWKVKVRARNGKVRRAYKL